MNKVCRLVIIVTALFMSLSLKAQLGIGEWRDHLSYSQALSVAETESSVFCSTRGGLFTYNKNNHNIQRLSKVTGLSETDIKAIEYNSDNDILLVAYSNANIDLIEGNRIINLSDIYRKQLTGKKTINNIMMHGDNAYLSCGFGIVVVNLKKKEISGTYFIGDEGSQLEVYETCTDQYDSIYAATESGIYKADINNNNLENYGFWKRETDIPYALAQFNSICYFDNRIFVNHHDVNNNDDDVFYKEGNSWHRLNSHSIINKAITCSEDKLIIISLYRVNIFNKDLEILELIDEYVTEGIQDPRYALIDNNNTLWIADYNYGLIQSTDFQSYESIYPNGPFDSNVWDMEVVGDGLWMAAGGLEGAWGNSWSNSGLSAMINNNWEVFNYRTIDEMDNIRDVVKVIVDPQNKQRVYAGTWGYGVMEFLDGELITIHNENNSDGSLQNIFPGSPYVRTAGLAFDSQNNLWITNSGVPNPISVKKTDGRWKNFNYSPYIGEAFMGEIIITPYDHKWVVLPRGHGLLAFDNKNTIDDETDDEVKKVNVRAWQPNGSVITLNDVYSIAIDLENHIWIGTNSGVVVFYGPERVFTTNDFLGSQPSVDLQDSIYHALLGSETVTAIAVDGANRKWLGTEDSGVFLVSEDGTEEILNFNISNSALPSNKIFSIAINNETGEVFIGTGKGIVSYRSTAIKSDFGNQEIFVFPNPVREDYDGPVTVRGLPYNSEVKITDISGNIVYETESLGGQAIWYGKNFRGERVQTGVYLVFASNSDASRKLVTKILFIH